MVFVFTDLQKNNKFSLFKNLYRIIFKKSKTVHIAPLFEKANIFTLDELFMMQLLQNATKRNLSAFSKTDKINTRSFKLDLYEKKVPRTAIYETAD